MDDVVVQVVPLHNSSTEGGSKLFSSACMNYETSVIVPYVTVYGVAIYKVLVCTRADKSTRLLLFCEFVSRYGRHQTSNHLTNFSTKCFHICHAYQHH